MTENLFSYGTLQELPIQLKTFGRILEGHPDFLIGFRITLVKIKEEEVIRPSREMTHYNNIIYTGSPFDIITGRVFIVTEAELKKSDEYEAHDDYERIFLELKSGIKAWVYHWINRL